MQRRNKETTESGTREVTKFWGVLPFTEASWKAAYPAIYHPLSERLLCRPPNPLGNVRSLRVMLDLPDPDMVLGD